MCQQRYRALFEVRSLLTGIGYEEPLLYQVRAEREKGCEDAEDSAAKMEAGCLRFQHFRVTRRQSMVRGFRSFLHIFEHECKQKSRFLWAYIVVLFFGSGSLKPSAKLSDVGSGWRRPCFQRGSALYHCMSSMLE